MTRVLFSLCKLCVEYKLKIFSVSKTKVIAFKRKESEGSRVMDRKQNVGAHASFLYNITYKQDNGVSNMSNKFRYICALRIIPPKKPEIILQGNKQTFI